MLHLLKVKVSGYKLLEENFTIDFTAKARVYENDKSKEIIEIDKGLYTFRTLAFVGRNSSGKSSILSLIYKVLRFLQTGRWEIYPFENKNKKIDLNVVFYLNGVIYDYSVILENPQINTIVITNNFSRIVSEKLIKLSYNKTRGTKNLELLQIIGEDSSELFNFSLNDTSAISRITNNYVFVDDFSNNNVSNFNEVLVRNTFFQSLNECERPLVSSIIKLLDESIEYIVYSGQDRIRFKRANDKERIISNNELLSILSQGTFRGVELYIRCINAIKHGKTIIVDEIENCFQKNLVYNLLFLFNDSQINKKGAQLFFSTHYVEILDYLSRRDSTFITHKDNSFINVKNLYSDYNVRTELLKSKQFDNNVFNTSINYKQLLEVRRALNRELCSNNDWRFNRKSFYWFVA